MQPVRHMDLSDRHTHSHPRHPSGRISSVSDFDPSRRRLLGLGLAGVGALSVGSLLSACASSAGTGSTTTGGVITLQSNLSSPQAEAGMDKLVAEFNKLGKGPASLNTIASEIYRPQLPTSLSSEAIVFSDAVPLPSLLNSATSLSM